MSNPTRRDLLDLCEKISRSTKACAILSWSSNLIYKNFCSGDIDVYIILNDAEEKDNYKKYHYKEKYLGHVLDVDISTIEDLNKNINKLNENKYLSLYDLKLLLRLKTGVLSKSQNIYTDLKKTI